jgi:hypothetical protein
MVGIEYNMEDWKDIIGYEGHYQISRNGEIRNKKNQILKSRVGKRGYYQIDLQKNGNRKNCYIHQLLAIVFLGHIPDGLKSIVDHIDGNKLNNKLDNLQIINHRQNITKSINKNTTSSKYNGVTWDKHNNKWKSQIRINGVSKHLGHFTDEYQAHIAYIEKLKNLCE